MKLCDMHCDTAMALFHGGKELYANDLHISLERAAVFEKYLQLAAFFTSTRLSDEEGWEDFLNSRKYFLDQCEKNGVDILKSGEEVAAWDRGPDRFAVILTVEDARLLAGHLERVEEMYRLGIRVVTPLWGGNTCIGGAHGTDNGLTEFGRDAVREMLRVGIVPDLSHASFRSADEILDLCAAAGKSPAATHMNAYALHPHSRNLTEDRYLRLAEMGGVAGISLYVRHLSGEETVTSEDAAKHLAYYEHLAPGHAGFGCDFDGADVPEDLGEISRLPLVVEKLRLRGMTEEQIEGIYYGNVLRFLIRALA
jgi:membrane dipeptidase